MVTTMLAASACNAQPTQSPPTLIPMQVIAPVFTPSAANLPLSETDVPRVSVEDAKAALDGGEAVIVDVRSADAYAASHIPGAINIQLAEIESNPTALNLDKNRWIITYCT
jgi:hypothetical protein